MREAKDFINDKEAWNVFADGRVNLMLLNVGTELL